MKKLLCLLPALALMLAAVSQHRTCLSTEVIANRRANDPAYDAQMHQQELALKKWVASGQVDPYYSSRSVRTIPVVVHILYNTSAQNITDAAVQNMISQMNADYSNQNPGLSTVRSAVQSLETNTQIQFCLAQQDPNGQPTTGIEHVHTTKTCFDANTETDNMKSTTTNGANAWDVYHYLNIWVVSICGSSPQTGGIAGYSYIPASGNGLVGNSTDGIVVDYSIGVGNNNPTWSHEAGHYLGLHHTWGDLSSNACGNVFPSTDDGFSDTPDSKQANFGCNYVTSCAGNSSYGDLIEDFMDYSDCTCLFTPQQSNYMNNTLTTLRSALVTNNNRCSTSGAPIASFTGTPTTVCAGQTVTFTSTSSGNPTSYSWSFTGGTPSTSTSANPTITYNTAGTYNVSLTATNGNGSNTATQSSYITVIGSTGNSLPLTEGFEGATFPPSGWALTNGDASTTWVRTTSASGYGASSASAYMYNFNYNAPGQKDWLITPSYNFSGVSAGRIKWDYAYALYAASGYSDTLEVLYSTNCGSSWTSLWRKGGAQLQTVSGNITTNFIPSSTQWKTDSVSLSALSGQSNVRFAFVNTNEYGQNVFLDNVNVYNSSSSGGSAPVADFIGVPTTVTVGNSVAFTDLSTNSPTSWSWSFPGGATTTSTTQNPTITYNTVGVYNVSLTATNSNGNNTRTKTSYINVVAAGSGTCDTLSNYTTADTLTVYTYNAASGQDGYISGTNTYGDLAKAEYYTNSTTAQVTGGLFYFVVAQTLNPATSVVTFKVWDATGVGGSPGTVLASQNVLINSIAADVTAQNLTYVSFSTPPTVTGNFYIGFTMSQVTGDTVAVVSGTFNSPPPNGAWEQWSDNTWYSFDDPNDYGVGTDMFELPILCTSGGGSAPTASFTANNTSVCAGSSVTFTSTSTGSPTSYSWTFTGGSPAASTSATQAVTYNTPGTYNVSLTAYNANGNNTSTQNSYITVYAKPTATTTTTTILCYGASTGSATVTASGGSSPYTYNWSGGGSSTTISNKPAGSYTVTVTDSHSCSSTANANITQPLSALTATPAPNDAACGLANGVASVNATGGAGGYQYHWNNGSTNQTQNNVAAGSYSVTVTDANGCAATTSMTVNNQTGNFSVTISATNPSCSQNNGSVVALPNNTGLGVTYQWSTGSTSGALSNLAPGTYSVTVTNSNGCTASASSNITNTGTSFNVSISITQAACGSSNGGATTSITGGTSPYTYNWSTGSSSSDISNVAAGAYNLTITDASGCSTTAVANVSNFGGPTVSVSGTSPNCYGGSNGSATVTATGGTAPYTYNWSSGSTSASAGNLAAGTYTVTVHDNAQCVGVQSVNITDPAQVAVNINVTSATCGNQNGSATAVATGGNNSFTYLWSNSATGAVLSNIAGGSYSVTVTDGHGCTAVATSQVNSAASPTLSVVPTDGTCQVPSHIDLTVTGGTSPFAYTWNNGASTEDLSSIPAGSYAVTVTDANNCTATVSASVTDNSAITVSFNTQQPGSGGSDGSITANATGGSTPYTYSWSNGGNSQTISNLPAGTYTVTITDGSGCIKVESVNLGTTGIVTVEDIAFIRLMPNPATNTVNIYVELAKPQDMQLQIFSSIGQQMWSRQLTNFQSGTEIVDLSKFAQGIYMVRVQSNSAAKTMLLVKQ